MSSSCLVKHILYFKLDNVYVDQLNLQLKGDF